MTVAELRDSIVSTSQGIYGKSTEVEIVSSLGKNLEIVAITSLQVDEIGGVDKFYISIEKKGWEKREKNLKKRKNKHEAIP